MAEQDQDQKTELPSEKRLSEAHERGQFAKTPELGIVFMLAAAFGALSMACEDGARRVAEYATGIFEQLHTVRISSGLVPAPVAMGAVTFAGALAPLMIASVGAALLSGGIQTGFRVTPKALGFKPEKLNPVTGFGRVFSKTTLVHGGIDFLKVSVIAFSLWLAARTLLGDPLFTAPVETAYLGEFIHRSLMALLARLLLAMGIIAAISYAYEWFKTHRELMMTRQEVKEERRQSDGDALVKSALRRMARRLMRRQMLAAVPTADVVVTNPTHYAVALKYERGIDKAPVVLAKGDRRLALRIKAIAAEHEVPTVEDRAVARLLFATGEVGKPIPGELYQAVAGILAMVYRTHRYYFFRLKSRRTEMRTAA
ncbi:EscU/YscU/HrcU family type III secretion system export apparatus switch protein [Opitutaceae bacterium TAV4]|nr:EscU/YscU/HrcU family type III secretion system export apparatus switch protein [Opitutaceae bacterium TAV4]RRK01869.1 EscU/YscU/HrcU family type III secretion system export apparatus switch protein [Opitutaceae bacterium TAV3]